MLEIREKLKNNLRLNFGLIEVLCKGLNWVTLPVVALFISPDVYGVIVLNYALITIFSSLMVFGQGRSILKFYSKNENWVISSTAVILCITAVVFIWINWFYEIRYDFIIIIISVFLGIHLILSLKLRVLLDFNGYLVIRLSYTLLRFILVPASILLLNDAKFYLWIELLAICASLLISRSIVVETFRELKLVELKKLLVAAKLGSPLFIQAMSGMIITNADKLFIAKLIDSASLGHYAILFSFASALSFVFAYYSMQYEAPIYRSLSAQAAKDHSRIFAKRLSFTSIILMIPLFLIYYLTAYFNSNIIFLPLAFTIVLIGQLFSGISLRGSYLLTYKERTLTILIFGVAASLVNLILNYKFIPVYGINGAAVASLSSNALLCVSLNVAANRR